jgi:hypothetical protein
MVPFQILRIEWLCSMFGNKNKAAPIFCLVAEAVGEPYEYRHRRGVARDEDVERIGDGVKCRLIGRVCRAQRESMLGRRLDEALSVAAHRDEVPSVNAAADSKARRRPQRVSFRADVVKAMEAALGGARGGGSPGGARDGGAPGGVRAGHGVEQLRVEGTSEELRAEQGRGVGWRSSRRSTRRRSYGWSRAWACSEGA